MRSIYPCLPCSLCKAESASLPFIYFSFLAASLDMGHTRASLTGEKSIIIPEHNKVCQDVTSRDELFFFLKKNLDSNSSAYINDIK